MDGKTSITSFCSPKQMMKNLPKSNLAFGLVMIGVTLMARLGAAADQPHRIKYRHLTRG